MATYIEVNGVKHPATITNRLNDREWNDRESKYITVEMSYLEAVTYFAEDASWGIFYDVDKLIVEHNEKTGEMEPTTMSTFEYVDCSEYSIAGDIIDHRDGTVTVKMGKPTAKELLAMFEEVL